MLLLIQMSCQPETDSISPSQTVVTVKIAEDNQGSTVSIQYYKIKSLILRYHFLLLKIDHSRQNYSYGNSGSNDGYDNSGQNDGHDNNDSNIKDEAKLDITKICAILSLTVTIDNDIETSSRKVFNQPDLDIDILIVPVNDTAAYNY